MLERASSTNGACKTGQLYVFLKKKSEIRSFFNTTQKNKLKTDERPKCEIRYYKTPRGKHRLNTLM